MNEETVLDSDNMAFEVAMWKKRYEELERKYLNLRMRLFRIDESEVQMGGIITECGFGTIYSALWSTKKNVAVKELQIEHLPEEEIIQQFVDQVELIHPNIVRVYGFTPLPKSVRIIMERMDMNVFEYLKKNPLTIPQKMDLMVQMVRAVHYIHTRSPIILHRGIKSFVFLISEGGKVVKLCDFGLLARIEGNDEFLHDTNMVGTTPFLAPEIIHERRRRYSVYSDIYSLGITFWEILFESTPLSHLGSNKNPSHVLGKITEGEGPDCTHPIAAPPKEIVEDLMEKMWAEEPKERPTSLQLMNWFKENGQKLKEKYEGVRFPPSE